MRRGLRRTRTAHTASRSNSAHQHPARASRTAPPRAGPPPAAPDGRDAPLLASATAAAGVSSQVAAHPPAAPGGSCTGMWVLEAGAWSYFCAMRGAAGDDWGCTDFASNGRRFARLDRFRRNFGGRFGIVAGHQFKYLCRFGHTAALV